MTAAKEANQDFAYKIDPCILCSYELVCGDIVGLRTAQTRADESVPSDDFADPWFAILAASKQPPSWDVAHRLFGQGKAGSLVPSFDPDATLDDHDLVLWLYDEIPPRQVRASDPSRRLPKDQL